MGEQKAAAVYKMSRMLSQAFKRRLKKSEDGVAADDMKVEQTSPRGGGSSSDHIHDFRHRAEDACSSHTQ